MGTNHDGEGRDWRRTLAFEDLEPGAVYDCEPQSLTAEALVAFAERFDPMPMHTDPDRAAAGPFGGLLASGLHTLSLSQAAAVEGFYGGSGVVASGGFEEISFPAPFRPGETMRVDVEVIDTRGSESDPGRGVVRTRRTGRVGTDDGTETVVDAGVVTVWHRDG